MPIPESKIEQYIKVRNLAKGTTGPEHDSAVAILGKLKVSYPDIEAAADALEKPKPNSGVWDWSTFISGLDVAVRTAASMMKGRELAKKLPFSTAHRKDGVSFKVTISADLLDQLADLNPSQQEVFLKTLGDDFSDYVRKALS